MGAQSALAPIANYEEVAIEALRQRLLLHLGWGRTLLRGLLTVAEIALIHRPRIILGGGRVTHLPY